MKSQQSSGLVWCVLVGCVVPVQAQPVATARADVRQGSLPDTNTVFKAPSYGSLDAWKARRAWLREQLRVAAGLWPEPRRTPLNARIFDRREYDGVTIEKVHFESYPGFFVFGNLYRPAKIEGKIPAVACAIGHWAHQRLQQDDNADYPALGRTLAALGMTVLVYDMTGYNEGTRQLRHGINTPALDLWGITSLGLQTWNSTRVIDFLQSLPEVDPERIGMTGASGGGTQTFILYSLDERIRAAVPVNMISSTMQGGCVCENAPCLRIDANNMEIGALMAPRPMLMISTTGDWTKLTPQVEYPFIRSIYELYGAADRVANAHFDFPHNYNRASRQAMYAFFARWLLNRSDVEKLSEPDLPRIDPKELAVWTDETAPKDLMKVDQLAEQLKAGIRERLPRDAENLDEMATLVRAGLRHMVGSEWPARESIRRLEPAPSTLSGGYEREGRRVAAKYAGDGHKVNPPGPVQVIVRPASAGGEMPVVAPRASGIVLTPFATGPDREAEAQRRQGKLQFFTTFNRTDAAEAVYDVLTGLGAELQGRVAPPVGLAGQQECGPICLVARAMIPEDVVRRTKLRTVIDLNGFHIDRDESYLKQLNIPHIRRIGGLRAIAAVACNGPVWFHNVGSDFDEEWVRAAGKAHGVEVRVTREKADEKALSRWLMAD